MNLHRPALLLIVLGLLLGPGYYAYCEYLSGQEAGRYELRERAQRWTLPDGSIQRFSGQAYQPLPVALTPQHNHVRLRLTFHADANAAAGDNRYQATLFDLDHPVVQRDLDVSLAPAGTRTLRIPAFAVHSPGEHLLVLEEVGAPQAAVSHVTVTVLQDAQRLIAPLAWGGVALLLGGAALLTYATLGGVRR